MTENMSSKQALLTDKLQKRDEIRKTEIEKKRSENEASTRERCEHFHIMMGEEMNKIESEIERSYTLGKDQLIDHFDSITVLLQKAQKFFSESTLFLPSYDIGKASESLIRLELNLQDKRNELLPKKKFAFKSKKAVDSSKDKKVTEKVKEEKKDKLEFDLTDCKFIDERDKTLTKQAEEINYKDVALANLRSCVVQVYGAPSAVHVNKLEDCKVFCGPVSGSVFIRDCVNCIFVLPCQQCRIHTTTKTSFYIHVTSKAIIEDCHDVKFAPFNWTYPELDAHYHLSGLDKERNNWNLVDDFNWLAADKSSPNWSIINSDDREDSWVS